jgi:hypothetical protein
MVNNFELKDTKYFLRGVEVEMKQFAANEPVLPQMGYLMLGLPTTEAEL